MKYLTLIALFALMTGIASAQIDHDCKPGVVKLSKPVQSTEEYDVYGEPWIDGAVPVSVLDAVTALQGDEAQGLVMVGRVAEVCQVKGCWMVLRDEGVSARVHFKDYGFFMPTDIAGRRVELFGSLKEKTISEEQARHYAEDANAENPEEITGPQMEYTFIASSVKVFK